jgi:hypothetical protein
MKSKIGRYKWELAGIAAGAGAGWCYWYFVGCASGSCAITSSPVNSTIYGAIMGALIGSMFHRQPAKQ